MTTQKPNRCAAIVKAVIVGCLAVMGATPSTAFAASGSWNVTTSGSWNTAGNWTPAAVPGTAAGDVVGLVNGITAARTVTINTAVTLGTLTIGSGSAFGFTLTGTTGGSLTLNNSGSGASIVQQAGSGAANTIATGFTLSDSFTVTNNQVTNGVTPLYALTISGNISESGGARTLTKTGAGTVVLSGSNTYSGKTTASAGILQFVNPSSLYGGTTATWTAANITSSSGATLAVRVGASNFTTGNVTTLLTNLGSLGGSVASGQGLQAGSSIGFDTSNAGGSFTLADAITNSTGAGGGSLGLVKLGSGTLSLTGLSSTAANNYTGTTIIDQGTLVLPASQTTRFTGGLTFGVAVGSPNVGTLDLSNGSAEFAGTTLVRSITGTNGITIGAGQSLTSKGNVQIGDSTGMTGSNPSQSLVVQGSGTWNVTASNGTFRVGNASSARGVAAALDASGLSTLSIDLRLTGSTGGAFVVNENVNAGGAPTVKLAAATTIKSNQVAVQQTAGGGTGQLLLGTGAQVLNANVLTIGNSVRASDTVQFQDAVNGTLTLRDAAGTGRAAVNLGNYSQNMSGALSSTLNVAGHSADLLMSTLAILDLGAANGNGTAIFSFDSGTFDATTVFVGRKNSTSVASTSNSATLNLGGTNNLVNTFKTGTFFMATMSSTTGTITAVTNIAGTTTSGTIASLTLATTSTTGGVANGTMNISGGSTTVTNGITLVNRSGTPGTANGTLNITGGSLSVGGTIATAGSGGTITSTVTLDGGALDLKGNPLGVSGQLIDTLNLRSGTLSNLGQFNAGADLVKTTSGTLSLTGTSTYTGATAVQDGVVRFNSVAASTGAQALGSGSVVNLGVAATSTGELDYFAATSGTFDKNVFALGNGRNRIRNSGGGTLTLSGTLTKNGTILELAGGTFAVTGRITGASQNSDLYVNNATVTLSNTNNDYNGPTYVYGGGTLTLGASNVIPNGSVLLLGGTGSDTGTGTLSLGTNSEGIGGLAFGSGGGTLKLVASATGSTAQLTAATGTMTLTGGTLDLTGSGTTAGSYRLFSAQSIAGSFTSITGSNAAYQILTTSTSYDYQQRAVLGAVTVTSPTVSIITGGSAAFTYTVGNSALSGGASLGFSTGSLSNLAGSSSGTTAAASTSGAISGLFFTGTSVGANQQGTFTVNAPTAYGATTATGTVSVNVLAHSNAALSLTSGGGQTIITGGSFANVGFNLTNAGSNRAAVQVNSLTNLTGSTGSAVVLSDGTASYSTSILDATTIGTGTLAVSLLAGDQQSLSGASALQTLNASTTYTVLDHALPGFQASGITNPYAQDVLNINFGSVDEAAGMQFFTYNLLNLASQTYGAGLTAGLDFTGVTPDGGGFASGLSTFNNLMGGGTSSLFTFTFNPTGQGSFSRTFTLRFADNQNLSGAASRRDLTINAQVIVVPEPGTLALSGIGAAAAAWMLRRRRPPRTGYSGACGKGFVPQPTRAIRQEGRDATADGDSLGRSVQRNALQRSRRGTFA